MRGAMEGTYHTRIGGGTEPFGTRKRRGRCSSCVCLLEESNMSAVDNVVRILLFGDSLTAGYRRFMPSTPYGDALQAAAEGRVAVTVSGVPGQRTTGMVERMNEEFDGVPHGSYPIAVLLGGTNDIGFGCSVDEVVDNLSLLVEGMQSRGSRLVVLLGIPQHRTMFSHRNGVIARKRKQINDRLRDMCGDGDGGLLYVDLDGVVPYFEEGSEVPSAAAAHLWDDGLHCSAEGYAAIGVCVFNAIAAHL